MIKRDLYAKALKGVPRVRLVDGDGKEIYRGYYWAIPRTTYCFKQDYDRHGCEIVEGIVVCDHGDWGLPNRPRLLKVTPPHRLELIPEGEL